MLFRSTLLASEALTYPWLNQINSLEQLFDFLVEKVGWQYIYLDSRWINENNWLEDTSYIPDCARIVTEIWDTSKTNFRILFNIEDCH